MIHASDLFSSDVTLFRGDSTFVLPELVEAFGTSRSCLTLGLSNLDSECTVLTLHSYRSEIEPFHPKQQPGAIAEQLARSLPLIVPRLLEEVSCLCCYGLQGFALTKRLAPLHREFQDAHQQLDAVEV